MDKWTIVRSDNPMKWWIKRAGQIVGHIWRTYHPTIYYEAYWRQGILKAERCHTLEEGLSIVKFAIGGYNETRF